MFTFGFGSPGSMTIVPHRADTYTGSDRSAPDALSGRHLSIDASTTLRPMARAPKLENAIAGAALSAGALLAVSDRIPWASFDATPRRAAVNLAAALPGLPLIACGLAWTGALVLMAFRSRVAVIASFAIAASAVVTALIQTRLSIGIYLDQATLLRLPAASVHPNAWGMIAAIVGTCLLVACAVAVAAGWIASATPAAAVRRTLGTAAMTAVLAASVMSLGSSLDPFSEPLPSLAIPTSAP